MDVYIQARFKLVSTNEYKRVEVRINEDLIPWGVNKELSKRYGDISELSFEFIREVEETPSCVTRYRTLMDEFRVTYEQGTKAIEYVMYHCENMDAATQKHWKDTLSKCTQKQAELSPDLVKAAREMRAQHISIPEQDKELLQFACKLAYVSQ